MLVNKCLRGLAPRISQSSAGQLFILQDVDTCGRLPAANSMCNGQPQPLVTGTLLFPVLRLGTVYQLSTATFARRLKAHLFVSTKLPAPRLIFSQSSIYIDGWLYGMRMTSVTFRCCLKTIPHIIILSSRHETDIPSLPGRQVSSS